MNQYRSHQKALRFIASIPLIQRRVKCLSREEKVPSRSAFSASMYVALKTRHVNPNIHVRRYQSHVRSPNFSATRPQFYSYVEQQPNRGHFTKLYRNRSKAIQLSSPSYIALPTHPYTYMRLLCKVTSSLLIPSSLENRSLQAERFEGGKCKL